MRKKLASVMISKNNTNSFYMATTIKTVNHGFTHVVLEALDLIIISLTNKPAGFYF